MYRGRKSSAGSPRRTPHGVRGLKYDHEFDGTLPEEVAPRTGCVD